MGKGRQKALLLLQGTLDGRKAIGCACGGAGRLGVEGFSGPEGPWPRRAILPPAHTAVLQCPQPAALCPFPDPGGRQGKRSPSRALSHKSTAILFSFGFHASHEPRPKWETGQESRVMEKRHCGARHSRPPTRTAEQTAAAGLSTSPLPTTRSHSGAFTWSLKQRLRVSGRAGACRGGGLWEAWAAWSGPLTQR